MTYDFNERSAPGRTSETPIRNVAVCSPIDLEDVFLELLQNLSAYTFHDVFQVNRLKLILWTIEHKPHLEPDEISSLTVRVCCLHRALSDPSVGKLIEGDMGDRGFSRWLFDFAANACIDEQSVASLCDTDRHEITYAQSAISNHLDRLFELSDRSHVPPS